MGTITINVDNEVEKKFRQAVKKVYGIGKGKLGKAVTEALKDWTAEKKQEAIAKRQIALAEKGFDMGRIAYKTRDELHERH